MKNLSIVATLLGCCTACGAPLVATTPHWDARFGDATRAAFARQTLEPGAALVPHSVDGIDGASAAAAQKQYQQSFTAPSTQQGAFTIGVSGAK